MTDAPDTLLAILDRAVAAHGWETAVSMRRDLRTDRWSYATLRQLVSAFAGHFRHELKLDAGGRVMISAMNSPMAVAAHLGAMAAGLIVVPMDMGSSTEFLASVAAKTEAALLLTSRPGLQVEGVRTISMADIDLARAAPCSDHHPAADDIAEIVFTSGTTGEPKGTVLSHGNIAADVCAASAIVPDRVPLHLVSILPLSHMLEQTAGLYLPMLHGGSVHYVPSLQPPVILRELRRRHATGMVVVPRFLDMMLATITQGIRQRGLERQWERQLRLAERLPIGWRRHLFRRIHAQLGGRLQFFLCGGAPLLPDTLRLWENMGVRVIEGYGSTECAPVIASNTYDDRRPGSIGRAVSGVEVKLADDGELWARGPNVARGYWRDDERTASAFTDGWFHTGDIAEIDADGILRITGRLGDRIVLASGQKVYPADIEAELNHEAGILDSVVLALPDRRGQERIHACLRIAPGQDTEAAASAAVQAANGRLGSHQHVLGHTIWSTGDFPRTNLGKVQRKTVKAALLESAQPVDTPNQTASQPQNRPDQIRAMLRKLAKDPDLAITDDSDIVRDLGLDSLGRVELGAAIETELGIALDEEKLSGVTTVKDLISLVEDTSHTGELPPFSAWALNGWTSRIRGGLQSLLVFPAFGIFARPFTIEGLENISGVKRPLLMIANHSSHADTLSILRALPKPLLARTVVAAAADYFYANRIAGALSSLFLNTFPFSRTGNVRASLERCGELADDDWSILIFPEGTRSPDGRLLPFKGGIGLLAKGLHAAVVPIAVEGGHAVLPKGASWPRRGGVTVRFGTPVTIGSDADPDAVIRQLETSVAQLMNPQNTGTAEQSHEQ